MFTNLSFETPGGRPGTALGWVWTRKITAFAYESFSAPDGLSRFETFEVGWNNDIFIEEFVSPTNIIPMQFGTFPPGGVVTPFENFERNWRKPNTPAPDNTHPGNETALFSWDSAESADFSIPQYPPNGQSFESFEAGWPTNENFFTSFTIGMLAAAPFAVSYFPPNGEPYENYEQGWLGNENYQTAWGANTPATFTDALGTHSAENFESVKADQPFTMDPTFANVFDVPGHGFSNGDKVTFYAQPTSGGGKSVLPTGLNPNFVYYVISASTDHFQVSTSLGGGAVTMTDNGNGALFVKANPVLYWTVTDVGV